MKIGIHFFIKVEVRDVSFPTRLISLKLELQNSKFGLKTEK
jgi:hypothetical protein